MIRPVRIPVVPRSIFSNVFNYAQNVITQRRLRMLLHRQFRHVRQAHLFLIRTQLFGCIQRVAASFQPVDYASEVGLRMLLWGSWLRKKHAPFPAAFVNKAFLLLLASFKPRERLVFPRLVHFFLAHFGSSLMVISLAGMSSGLPAR